LSTALVAGSRTAAAVNSAQRGFSRDVTRTCISPQISAADRIAAGSIDQFVVYGSFAVPDL